MKIASKALHATFMYSTEHRFLLDAGEGVATQLGDAVYSMTKIFLSHGHIDHIAGLPTLIHVRNRQKDANKLCIYYPARTPEIQNWRNVIGPVNNVEWIGVEPGSEIAISATLTMRAFETRHLRPAAGCKSLGYLLVETRTRRKAEYQGLSDQECSALVKQGKMNGVKITISEPFKKSLFAYTGDTGPLSEATLRSLGEPETLIHDSTFLMPVDRENANTHSTLKEAIDAARVAGAKRLIGIHVSPRQPYLARWERIIAGLPSGVRLIAPTGIVEEFDIACGSHIQPPLVLLNKKYLPPQPATFSTFCTNSPLRNS